MGCGVRDHGADGEAVHTVARGAVEHVEVGGGGKELLVVASCSARSLSLLFPPSPGASSHVMFPPLHLLKEQENWAQGRTTCSYHLSLSETAS